MPHTRTTIISILFESRSARDSMILRHFAQKRICIYNNVISNVPIYTVSLWCSLAQLNSQQQNSICSIIIINCCRRTLIPGGGHTHTHTHRMIVHTCGIFRWRSAASGWRQPMIAPTQTRQYNTPQFSFVILAQRVWQNLHSASPFTLPGCSTSSSYSHQLLTVCK